MSHFRFVFRLSVENIHVIDLSYKIEHSSYLKNVNVTEQKIRPYIFFFLIITKEDALLFSRSFSHLRRITE